MALPFAIPARFRRATVRLALRLLTKPLKGYTLRFPNDIANLKRTIRKGDVLLVEGNERISECIKYLTQSCWSHSALYVGDEALKRDPLLRARLLEQFGEEANYLLVEALVQEGVVLTPLARYQDFNLRVCRPASLTRKDLARVLDEVLSAVGKAYDLRNTLDLLRYFLPVNLVPRRLRRSALELGSGEPTQVICSSMIASAFQTVRFPIMPLYREPPQVIRRRGLARLLRWRDTSRIGLLQSVPTTLVTPREFDLSPYFEVVKLNPIEDLRFNYHHLKWVEEGTADGKLQPAASTLEKDAAQR